MLTEGRTRRCPAPTSSIFHILEGDTEALFDEFLDPSEPRHESPLLGLRIT
jgi:hypothetical protein